MASQPPVLPPDQSPSAGDEGVPTQLAVCLDSFEGPLDLLVELIRKHEIDIFDIPISMITDKYLKYVEHMEALDLQIGGEWLEMAATLIHIKSKMLLPDDDDDDPEGPNPRAELVRRLIEHQKYQFLAGQLADLPRLDRDVFTHRAQAEHFEPQTGPAELRPAGLGDLVGAIDRLIRHDASNADWVVELSRETLSLRVVMVDIASLLQHTPRVTFEQLFADHEFTRYRVVTTFVALLEMTKRKIITLLQSRMGDEHLYIERSVIDVVEVSQTLDIAEEAHD